MPLTRMLRLPAIAIALHGPIASADPTPSPAHDRESDPPVDRESDAAAVDDPAVDRDAAAAREPAGQFEIGAGYRTDDGFIAGASVSTDDLFRTGTSLSLGATLSQREQTFAILFRDPHLGGTDLALDLELQSSRREWPGFVREGAGGSITLSHPLGRSLRGFASYRLEDATVELDPVGTPRLEVDPGPTGGAVVSSIRTGLLYDTRDTPLLPRRGTDAGAWIERADPRLGSDADLLRARAWARHHRPLGPFTLHLGASIGSVTSRDPGGVPLSERLQLDGSSELRGYRPGALGPVDTDGVARGGNLQVTARAELEFPLWPRIGLSGAVFADAAALADLEGGVDGRTGQSVGAGLVWRSPIGPIAAYLAYPLDGEREGPALMFTLGVGF